MDAAPEPPFLETLYRDLALALGDAVWAFARLEWLTYEFIGRLSHDRLDELLGDMPFRGRISILRKLVDRRDLPLAQRDEISGLFQSAEKLADRRNIIVHNPWKIWIDLDARKFMTEIQKYSDDGRKLDLEELRTFAKSAAEIENSLKQALGHL